jgi:epoxyqueuosine reductase
LYGCDDCQEVCPPAVRFGDKHRIELGGTDEPVQAWVDVLDLLDATDAELIERYGRWYLAERNPVWWRRNALIVLGNVGDVDDERTQRTLARYRCGDDEMLREHADWAATRLASRAAV